MMERDQTGTDVRIGYAELLSDDSEGVEHYGPDYSGSVDLPDRDELARLLFNRQSYMFLYPDIAEISAKDPGYALFHFQNHGAQEGRSPSILFDTAYVMHVLTKMKGEQVSNRDAFLRYLDLPANERFVPNRWFSAWAFRQRYGAQFPDLRTLSDAGVFEFYLARAAFDPLSPNGVFDEESYRSRTSGVAAAVGRGEYGSGFLHFVSAGAQHGARNLPGLVPGAGNPADVAREAAWILSGQPGLGPVVWWFDETFYLTAYPDAHDLVRRAVCKSGLEHFVAVGFREGRVPHPACHDLQLNQVGDDPWKVMAGLPPRPSGPSPFLTIGQASALVRRIDCPGWNGCRDRLTELLWPCTFQPVMEGTNALAEYIAVNTDLATLDPNSRQAIQHWSEFGIREERVAPNSNPFSDRSISLRHILAWRNGVNFFGPVKADKGLGNAARGYVAALRSAGIPVNVYDAGWIHDPAIPAELLCSDDLEYSINFICLNADQIPAFVRKYGTGLFKHRANVAAWVWELAAPRPEWRRMISAFDLILAPTRFCADSFALATDIPVRTVPYVVDEAELLRAAKEPTANHWLCDLADQKAAGKKVVLFIMDASSYTARKGVDLFCRMAERVERREPGRYLFVVKSHSQDVSLASPQRFIRPIVQVEGVFSFSDLCRLKQLADLYVSPHRSEGFGLNIVESILLGVPVLCTGFGGVTDLLKDNVPPLIPYTLKEIGRDIGPYRKEATWAEPDADAMEALLLDFFAKPRDERGFKKLRKMLAREFSTEAVGKRLRRELGEFCGLRADDEATSLDAFRALASNSHEECFALGYVREDNRRSPDSPGLARLSQIASEALRPNFSVITPTFNTEPAWLFQLYDDLVAQSYPSWEWCICDDGSTRADTIDALRSLRRRDARVKLQLSPVNRGISAATNAAVAIAQSRYVVMVDHDDRLSPDLLAAYMGHLDHASFDGILYCDEDKIDSSGARCDHYHKPDWSPEHLLSCMYLLHCLCIRKSLFLGLGGYRSEFDGAQDHDFALRAAAGHYPVRHVDQVLYHWRMTPNSTAAAAVGKPYALEAGRRAVAEYLGQLGVAGTVEAGVLPGTYRVRPALPREAVAINILTGFTPRPRTCPATPSRHGSAEAGGSDTYAEQLVRSILATEAGAEYEIRLVVDEQRMAAGRALTGLDPRVRIVPFRWSGSSFNFAEKANFAVRTSASSRVVLLNDDMEVLEAGWLAALLEPLELPGVGVVGGRLLYGDNTVQHAGIALGVIGAATHLFEGVRDDYISYNAFNVVMRNYSAVTGAMMAFHKAAYEKVGGFDVDFPIDFNDVDFCLRMGRAHHRTVYTPFARMRHYESRSAQRLAADALDHARFHRRWSPLIQRDPYYNRNLPRDDVFCGRPGS